MFPAGLTIRPLGLKSSLHRAISWPVAVCANASLWVVFCSPRDGAVSGVTQHQILISERPTLGPQPLSCFVYQLALLMQAER